MINRVILSREKLHHTFHFGETWTHALYCGALFIEGHGLYAVIGGVLGIFVVLNTLVGGIDA